MIDRSTLVAYRGSVVPAVARSEEDPEVRALVRSDEARARFGVGGRGHAAAVIDSGIYSAHLDFTTREGPSRVIAAEDFTGVGSAEDETGHGSHIAGIIAANGPHRGIAPEAALVNLRVFAKSRPENFDPIAQALAWVRDNHAKYGISVVCMSLGNDGNYIRESDTHDHSGVGALVSELADLRIACCVSSGNRYGTYREPGMSFPAIVKRALSVGAVYDADVGRQVDIRQGTTTDTTRPDQIATFSQRLHASHGDGQATTIFAPAARVESSGLGDPRAATTMAGTSQAAPVVAGVVLLLQEFVTQKTGARPTVAELWRWLREDAVPIYDGDDENGNVPATHVTYGRVDTVRAIEAAARSLGLGHEP